MVYLKPKSHELGFNDGTSKTLDVSELLEIRDRLNRWYHSEISNPTTARIVAVPSRRVVVTPTRGVIRPYSTNRELSYRLDARGRIVPLDKYTSMINSTKPISFPRMYTEIGRRKCDPKGAYGKHTYVYAKHVNGCYGFKVVNGMESPFYRLGRINEQDSIIGSFIRVFPTDKILIKYDILQLKVPNVTEGRRLKALLDILEIEGYLIKTPLVDRRGKMGYKRSQKSIDPHTQNTASENNVHVITVSDQITKKGLEVENNDELRKVPRVSSNPLAASGRLT